MLNGAVMKGVGRIIARVMVRVKGGITWLIAKCLVCATRVCAYVHVAELCSLVPLGVGNQIRYKFYRSTLAECGENVTVNFGSVISNAETKLGSHIWIGTFNVIGLAEIKDYTLTGPGCCIVSGARGHAFSECNIPVMDQPFTAVCCCLGPDVWIGTNAVVMANIGRGCVIGAGSVVNRDIPDWSIAVGNPARVIRKREVQGCEAETKGTDRLR